MKRVSIIVALLLSFALPRAQVAPPFQVEEATIAQIHDALKAGRITCHGLVERYLRRIEAYDKNGPAINAIIVVNPEALKQADDLDRRSAQGGLVGPLHCVPTIVKDNFETIGLQSANGSLALAGLRVEQGRVSGEADQGRPARSSSPNRTWRSGRSRPYETLSSILPGYTKNPYALDRVTAGSSGGTAASVAASFGSRGPRQRHRQLDPRSVVTSGARRHSIDDGVDEPRWRDAAQFAGGHRRTDGAHA